MAIQDEKHEWGAKKVRDTFLDYFNNKNAHSFGAFSIQSLRSA
jgi:alanyl-tRNA synthetase